MENSLLIIVLAVGTLVLVIGIALHQLKRVRHSQHKRDEHPGGLAGPSEE